MKQVIAISTGLIFFWITACNNKNAVPVASNDSVAAKNYIPVRGFLRSEINYVDSLPLGISRVTKLNGHSDTVYIRTPEFDSLSMQFLLEELDSNYFKKNFTETSFFDQTTQMLNFTYAANNDIPELRRVDVLVSVTGNNHFIQTVYLQKISRQHDTTTTTNMFWQSRKAFEIATSKQSGNAAAVTSELHLIWDHSE